MYFIAINKQIATHKVYARATDASHRTSESLNYELNPFRKSAAAKTIRVHKSAIVILN